MLKKWLKKTDGIVAVEFALLAIPFCLLTIGMIETAVFFAAGIVLEGGASDAARMIRTGQVQDSLDPEDTFKAELCYKISALIPCNDVKYEVIKINTNTFAGAQNLQPQFDQAGNLIGQGFDAGDESNVILVRAAYKYEFLTPFLGSLMGGGLGQNWAVHLSTVVIKNEPERFVGG